MEYDAAYFVQPNVQSRAAGCFYLLNTLASSTLTPSPTPNGPILTECKMIKRVMSSAAEVKTIGVYHNRKVSRHIRQALEALGHPQPRPQLQPTTQQPSQS